jgi:lipopolysaccharide transport system ATP-binding protein
LDGAGEAEGDGGRKTNAFSPEVVRVSGLSKRYDVYASPRDRLREALSFGRRKLHSEVWALRDVSFSVRAGTTFGIMGENGSGKSTLLKVICGFLAPTSGSVRTEGRICPILELGTGFNPEFTGRQNVILYGGLLGFSRQEMVERLPEIEAFADIGDFFDKPCRIYSSGMYVRLAFACTAHLEPDILVVDEALAVGDIAFQHKCMSRIRSLQERGVTILFVSHSLGAIKSLCDEAILLEKGRIIHRGGAEEVANTYHALVAEREQNKALGKGKKPAAKVVSAEAPGNERPAGQGVPAARNRSGTGEVVVRSVAVVDETGRVIEKVGFNQEVRIRLVLEAREDYRSRAVGFIVRDKHGNDLLGTNTYVAGVELPTFQRGRRYELDFRLRLPLVMGTYSVTVAVAQRPDVGEYRDWLYCDWWDNACFFEMLPPEHGRLCGTKVQLPVEIRCRPVEDPGE